MAARSSPPEARDTHRGALPTLRSRADFVRIETAGRTRSDRLVVVRFVPNELDHDRYGISTGRRLGGAVQRNRVRRRIREILRRRAGGPGPGRDILIVARPPSADASSDELGESLERLLGRSRARPMSGAS